MIINGWTLKFLSKAGKKVLIKLVAAVLPIYVMSYFRLPKSITDPGGVQMVNKKVYIGYHGKNYVVANQEGELAFEISKILTLNYWQISFGD